MPGNLNDHTPACPMKHRLGIRVGPLSPLELHFPCRSGSLPFQPAAGGVAKHDQTRTPFQPLVTENPGM
eukprot:1361775-Amorphochlora_amoeboformis.AAC.1